MSLPLTVRSTCWSVTINNPTQQDYDCMKNPTGHKDFISCEGQLEEGENGTPHLQLMLKTKSMKFSAVKKLFPRGHIEPARSAAALANYVNKEETRIATIAPAMIATVATLNNALTEVWANKDEVDEYIETLSDEEFLRIGICILDKLAVHLIMKGYHGVEYIASNPSVRSAWKLYYKAIVYRQYATPTQATQGEPPPPPSEQSDESA